MPTSNTPGIRTLLQLEQESTIAVSVTDHCEFLRQLNNANFHIDEGMQERGEIKTLHLKI